MDEQRSVNAPEERALTQEELSELLQIRRDKLKSLQDAGRDPFEIVRYDQQLYSADVLEKYDALEGKSVSLAGRMMSKRIMGKASFAHLLDYKGDIQIYVRRDDVGEEAYADFKTMDIGDILGVVQGVQNPHRGGFYPCGAGYAAFQVATPPAGKVPRPEGPGASLPPALCGSHRESRGTRNVCEALKDHRGDSQPPERKGLH